MPRRLAPAVSFVLLLGLFVYLFWVPLRPSAWGGPRQKGPFEPDGPRAVGRWARDVRIPLERIATGRSPDQPLAATAETLLEFHALLAAGRFIVLWLVLRRLGGSVLVATLGVVAAALPVVLGGARHDEWDVGLLLFVGLLAGTTPARIPWWVAVGGLPALFALWANAHASVVAGLGWLAVVTAGRAVEWWRARQTADAERPAVVRLLLALALCAGAACLNPDGPRLYLDAIRAAKGPNNSILTEWQPVDFTRLAGQPWLYFATLAALLVAQLASRRAMTPTGLLVLLTFGFWPVLQQRGLGYWWLIVPWLTVPLVVSAMRHWRSEPEPEAGARAEARLASALAPASGSGPLVRWIALVAIVLAVLTTPAVRWLVLGPRDLETIVTADTPARLARELTTDRGNHLPELRDVVRANYPDGQYRGAILAGPEQGDFLAWVLDGDNLRPVLIYSRPETFDPAIWGEAVQALEGANPWWEILGRHQVNLVAINPARWEKLAGRLRRSAEWAIVEDGPALLVTVRRRPKLPAELQP